MPHWTFTLQNKDLYSLYVDNIWMLAYYENGQGMHEKCPAPKLFKFMSMIV